MSDELCFDAAVWIKSADTVLDLTDKLAPQSRNSVRSFVILTDITLESIFGPQIESTAVTETLQTAERILRNAEL